MTTSLLSAKLITGFLSIAAIILVLISIILWIRLKKEKLLNKKNGDISRAEEILETQRRFISDAAHELRTPLTAIHGSLEVLMRGAWDDKETALRLIQGIYRETTRLTRLTEQLLNLSRINSIEKLETERTDIGQFIKEFAETAKLIAGERKIVTEGKEGLYANINRDSFKQILYNITDNAVQYTEENGTIAFRWEEKDNNIYIYIADNGSGIPKESISRIFEPFYRAEKSRARRTGGSGLGLAIVKNIVEAHRGNITVNSEPGKGTVFSIRIPSAL